MHMYKYIAHCLEVQQDGTTLTLEMQGVCHGKDLGAAEIDCDRIHSVRGYTVLKRFLTYLSSSTTTEDNVIALPAPTRRKLLTDPPALEGITGIVRKCIPTINVTNFGHVI